jgi:hypothetical protein
MPNCRFKRTAYGRRLSWRWASASLKRPILLSAGSGCMGSSAGACGCRGCWRPRLADGGPFAVRSTHAFSELRGRLCGVGIAGLTLLQPQQGQQSFQHSLVLRASGPTKCCRRKRLQRCLDRVPTRGASPEHYSWASGCRLLGGFAAPLPVWTLFVPHSKPLSVFDWPSDNALKRSHPSTNRRFGRVHATYKHRNASCRFWFISTSCHRTNAVS